MDSHADALRPAKRPRSQHGGGMNQGESSSSSYNGRASGSMVARAPVDPSLPTNADGKRLSCAECRRLKLKCNRQFPCESCCKRGVSSICPNGALKSGQGSRFILANTEDLHNKIAQMSNRIRELEEVVRQLQSRCSHEPHPSLAPELLLIKTSQELYAASSETPPQDTFERDLAPSQVCDQAPNVAHPTLRPPFSLIDALAKPLTTSYSNEKVPLPEDILALSRAFPVPWSIDIRMRQRIRDFLPGRAEARHLYQQALHHALWQYNTYPMSLMDMDHLAHHVYQENIEDVAPRRLALFLMMLAIGKRVDSQRGDEGEASASGRAEAFHNLARAAVSETPVFEEPNYDLVHSLLYFVWYQVIFSDDRKSVGYAWCMMGLAAKLAISIGLHRDESQSAKIIPEEIEKRRLLFWELMNLDSRLALSLGRPQSLHLRHVSTQRPTYSPDFPGRQYHEWKHHFFVGCLEPVLAVVVGARPTYQTVLDLDNRVREFEIPDDLDKFWVDGAMLAIDSTAVLQCANAFFSRDVVLLQLHRIYCVSALTGTEPFTLHNQFSPSVMAVYMSSRSLVNTVRRLYQLRAELSLRFLNFWCNAFAAAVTFCLIVCRAPFASIAGPALLDLEQVIILFESAGARHAYIGRALPVLMKLSDKAKRLYEQFTQMHKNNYSSISHPGPKAGQRMHTTLFEMMSQAGTVEFGSPQRFPQPALSVSRTVLTAESTGGWPNVNNHYGLDKRREGEREMLTNDVHPFLSAFPSQSRVHGQEFNFDFGVLNQNLDDQSWMLWF